MEKLLIFIKHHFRYIWRLIEYFNKSLFAILYYEKLSSELQQVISEVQIKDIRIRILVSNDANSLFQLINSQPSEDLEFFRPHGFDTLSIQEKLRDKSFLMMGMFLDNSLVGYFFLRCFINKKCFVGRLLDANHRGQGFGAIMNRVMYETSWRSNFRCFSTISRKNSMVMRAHSKNSQMIFLKELRNDYILVEFVK